MQQIVFFAGTQPPFCGLYKTRFTPAAAGVNRLILSLLKKYSIRLKLFLYFMKSLKFNQILFFWKLFKPLINLFKKISK